MKERGELACTFRGPRRGVRGKLTHLDSLLCVRLLNDADPCIRDEDGEDDDGLDVGGRFVVPLLEVGEDERDASRREEDEDELVLKLLEDELPQRRRFLLGQDWTTFRSHSRKGGEGLVKRGEEEEKETARSALGRMVGVSEQPVRTVLAVFALVLVDLLLGQALRGFNVELVEELLGALRVRELCCHDGWPGVERVSTAGESDLSPAGTSGVEA